MARSSILCGCVGCYGPTHAASCKSIPKATSGHCAPKFRISRAYSHDHKTSNFYDELCERLSALCRKGEKKGRKKSEVDAVICWLTGYNQRELNEQLKSQKDLETFFKEAPRLNPSRTLIKGVVCGVRVEDIQEPTMQEIRYLDKLVDELAKGKAMENILRA